MPTLFASTLPAPQHSAARMTSRNGSRKRAGEGLRTGVDGHAEKSDERPDDLDPARSFAEAKPGPGYGEEDLHRLMTSGRRSDQEAIMDGKEHLAELLRQARSRPAEEQPTTPGPSARHRQTIRTAAAGRNLKPRAPASEVTSDPNLDPG